MANPSASPLIESPGPDNPYVGPRTFTQAESSLFFGREREARDLLSLVISQRLVLFYSQSGAGKSSLVNTRLIPQLRDEDFLVLPVARVGGDLPAGIGTVDNIYAFNLMLGLDQGNGNPGQFARLNLTHFLDQLTSEDGETWYYDEEQHDSDTEIPAVVLPSANSIRESAAAQAGTDEAADVAVSDKLGDEPLDEGEVVTPYVLIIDQFEEIITNHPDHWPEREAFFQQLESAMRADPALWVILVLREDFVAALDPYAHIMSDKLRARFYMERMGVEAAHQAISRPAEVGGRPFADGVAEQLIDNLRRVRGISSDQVEGNAGDGPESSILDQYLEPVQLQVVCYQLWENIRHTPPAPISFENLEKAGNVDTALAAFYEDAIHNVLTSSQVRVTERELRVWFADKLITEAETRGTVYQGTTDTAGMPNDLVTLLSNQFLLRAELRAGGAWIELVHDRFVEPILKSNRSWLARQSPLMRASQRWESTRKDPALLLPAQQLEALTEESDLETSDPLIKSFIAASKIEIRKQAAAERAKQSEVELEHTRAVAQEAEARLKAEAERAAEAEARQQEQAETAVTLKRFLIGLTALGIAALVLAGIAWNSSSNANVQRNNAVAAQVVAVGAQETAVAERNNAAAAQAEAETAEAIAIEEADKAATSQAEAIAESTNAAAARATADIRSETAVAQWRDVATQAATAMIALATNEAKADELALAIATVSSARDEAIELAQTQNEKLAAEENEPPAPTPQPQFTIAAQAAQADSLVKSVKPQPTAPALDDTAQASENDSSYVETSPLPTSTPDVTATALKEQLDSLATQSAIEATAAVETATADAAATEEAAAQANLVATRTAVANIAQISLQARPPEVAPGDCSVLLWQTSNVREVYYQDQGVAGVGLRTECPTENTTYYLRVVTQSGEVIFREDTIFVDENEPRQNTLAPYWDIFPTSPSIPQGECVYIIWETRNVSEVFYQKQGVTDNDLRRECPTEDATFELVVVTQDGVPYNKFVTVRVQQE